MTELHRILKGSNEVHVYKVVLQEIVDNTDTWYTCSWNYHLKAGEIVVYKKFTFDPLTDLVTILPFHFSSSCGGYLNIRQSKLFCVLTLK